VPVVRGGASRLDGSKTAKERQRAWRRSSNSSVRHNGNGCQLLVCVATGGVIVGQNRCVFWWAEWVDLSDRINLITVHMRDRVSG